MSDYFGALIRSSSLAVGASGSPPAVVDAPNVSSDIVEIHEERTAPTVEQHPRPLANERVAAASSERIAPTARQPHVAPPAVNASAGVSAAPAPHIEDVRRRHGLASEESNPDPVRRDPDPVRLAMQWVAADPGSRIIGAPPSIEGAAPGRASLRAQEPAVFIEPPHAITERITSEARRRDRAQEPLQERPGMTVRADPRVRAVSEQAERAAATSTIELPHEEVVEISIGAINLHVEAPAPQTVVQATPPAHSQPAPETRAARSGLSRRYLRSF